jgi:hypothetical protein
MLIRDLYDRYTIMPQLVTHQLRVGGIVRIITADWSDQDMARECVTTALVHDLGNIVKFDLVNHNAALLGKLDNAHYWRAIQKDQRERYGSDAHTATCAMLQDAGLSLYHDYIQEECHLFDTIDTLSDYSTFSHPATLTLYADSRVTTERVATLEERIVDLETRYGKRRNDRVWAHRLEEYVQGMSTVLVSQIVESDVAALFDELLSYNIQV